jgi:hypothetical protein
MRCGPERILTFAVLSMTLLGCGHPMQKKLEGRWLGQSVDNVDDESFAAATGWAKGVSMEFAGSTVTVAIPAEEPRSGAFKILGVHDGVIQVAINDERGQTSKTRFKLDDERSLRWMVGEGRAVVMRRE